MCKSHLGRRTCSQRHLLVPTGVVQRNERVARTLYNRDSGHSHWPQNPDSEKTKSKAPILRSLEVSKSKSFQSQHKMREAEGRQVWRCNNFLFSEEFWEHSALQRSYSPSPWSRQKYTQNCQKSSQSPQNRLPGALLYCFPDMYPLGGCYTALKKKSCPGSMFRKCSHIQSVWGKNDKIEGMCVCAHTCSRTHVPTRVCKRYTQVSAMFLSNGEHKDDF